MSQETPTLQASEAQTTLVEVKETSSTAFTIPEPVKK